MPIILTQVLAFLLILSFSTATVPSSNIGGSLPRRTIAAVPSLVLSGDLIVPPFPAARPLRNISNDLLPPNYLIPDTDPPVILQINPTRHLPLDYDKLTYMIVHGLDYLVQDTIQSRGDSPIPQAGMFLNSDNAAIAATSHHPGTQDLTYGTLAKVLRGLWEIAALFRPCELDIDVYIGRQDETHHRGHLALYWIAASRETA